MNKIMENGQTVAVNIGIGILIIEIFLIAVVNGWIG